MSSHVLSFISKIARVNRAMFLRVECARRGFTTGIISRGCYIAAQLQIQSYLSQQTVLLRSRIQVLKLASWRP